MQKTILTLHKMEDGTCQSFIKNNHGRKLYLHIAITGDNCEVIECFYIDRAKRVEPKLLKTRKFILKDILDVIARELDKKIDTYCIESDEPLSTEAFIDGCLKREKLNILLLLKDGDTLRTIFKNRFRREIYLEIDTSGDKALIKTCRYCDVRGTDVSITPYHLTTIYFDFSFQTLLKIVNFELEGGFTDIIISDTHTIELDRPICGSI